ncbi:MAG: C25 family cysteine peptidase, partial [Bacteroidota bacterium]
KGIVNSNSLKEGANQLSVTNADNGTNPNFLALDWYEIEYPKQLTAQNDSLIFKIDDTLDRKVRAVRVKNVSTANVVLYKIKPAFKKIESFQLAGTNLVFTDTIGGNDQYFLIPGTKISAPKFLYEKKFSNLRDNNRSAGYIAITHDNFLSAVQQYTANISKMYNVAATVVNIKDIFDEFTFGYPYPEAIRSFLNNAYKLWQTPKPNYVVLIGDANYDYKKFRYKNAGVIGGGNFVPSFGFPVSDNWFAVFNNDSVLPQMMVGRLPINTVDELVLYNDKVKNNYENFFNDWNKKYLFFSGGRGTEEQLKVLKNVNDTVINKYVKPAPAGGKVTHFYKTITPQTDFGPYTQQQFNAAIGEGAIVIPYLGHSGTATWDNGINEITQLKNKVNRNPLILDFGCSTNKFAEPDIVSFGERFILKNDGQAIGYIGNSSLGFLSTALVVPSKFFEILANEPTLSFGEILLKTKIGLIGNYGGTSTNKLFALTGTLLGDPIVKMKMPFKSNLFIDENSFLTKESYFGESNDSVLVRFAIQNLGRVETKDYGIKFIQKFGGTAILEKNITRSLPLLSDTLTLWIKTKNYPGEHELELNLDILNQIDEIYENDNTVKVKINVFSSELRDLFSNDFENSAENYITILNPVDFTSSQLSLQVEVSDNYDFQNPMIVRLPAGELFTRISLKDFQTGKRFWIRYKIDGANTQFSKVKSFFNSNTPPFFLNDQYSFSAQKLEGVVYSDNKIQLGIDTLKIFVTSAGWYAGANAVIAENGKNLLTNSFFAGMGLVVFDEKTLKLEYSDWYELFNNQPRMQQLVDYINSIPQGKIVVLAVADDAANNISIELKNAVKTLGSTKIDSLQFRGSWALIGKKSALPEDVIEKVKGPYDGLVQIEKVFTRQTTDGKLTTTKIGPASVWKKLLLNTDVPIDSQLKIKPIAIDKNGKEDTLSVFQINNGVAELSSIDAEKNPFIKIITEFNSAQGDLPALKSLGVDYAGVPELGTNYQVVSVSKDTVEQGEIVDLSFYLYNVGKTKAENFKVMVEAAKKDNTREKIFEAIVDSLAPEQKKIFNIPYSTASVTGPIQFNISIDPENKILELYEDNNFYSVPIYVYANTKPATLRLTFDGSDIINGDYVSPNPNIRIELHDQSLLPIKDTTAMQLFLNNKRIYYVNNTALTYSFSLMNPKFVVDYKPVLENGTYIFKVIGRNATDQLIDSTGVARKFSVQKNFQLLDVYNYPNPFSNETYFTFKLTQLPEEMRIHIYTLAGRMIKEFNLSSAELKFDFNKIYWDGRDEDGDLVANGVYLYKIITKKGNETFQATQKLAIVR